MHALTISCHPHLLCTQIQMLFLSLLKALNAFIAALLDFGLDTLLDIQQITIHQLNIAQFRNWQTHASNLLLLISSMVFLWVFIQQQSQ
jgi:hypothetical protein